MSKFKLVVSESISEVPTEPWARLTETDVYGQHGWFKAIEACAGESVRPIYFQLYDDDQLVASAAGYRGSRIEGLHRMDDLLFGSLSRLARQLGLIPARCIYFGPLIGHGRHLFWRRDCAPAEARQNIRRLLDAIAEYPSTRGNTLVFGRIPAEETLLIEVLRQQRLPETQSWPISYLDIEWENFDQYAQSLSGLGKNHATKIRRERAAPDKCSVALANLSDFGDRAEEMDRLFSATSDKHGGADSGFGPEFVRTLNQFHTPAATMNIAQPAGDRPLLGSALLLTAEGTASGPIIGVADNEQSRRAFVYFNLAFYAPIQYCIDKQIRRIYFGGGLRKMKQKRGCKEMDVHVFVSTRKTLGALFWRAWFTFHRRRIQKKARQEIR